jgi:hypothetical protein
MLVDGRGAEVTQCRAPFRDQHAFGGTQNPQRVGIDLCDKERSTVAENVVVVRASPCIDRKSPSE